jgi:hypothetical protein
MKAIKCQLVEGECCGLFIDFHSTSRDVCNIYGISNSIFMFECFLAEHLTMHCRTLLLNLDWKKLLNEMTGDKVLSTNGDEKNKTDYACIT